MESLIELAAGGPESCEAHAPAKAAVELGREVHVIGRAKRSHEAVFDFASLGRVVQGRGHQRAEAVRLEGSKLNAGFGRQALILDSVNEIRTERLVLRRWCEEDREPFARLNADPVVMEHFQQPLTRAESDAFIDRMQAEFEAHGFGRWAVEVPGQAPLAGFVGLAVPRFQAPFMPAVEIGWRLARGQWGHGYATEAARAAIAHGFREVGLEEMVSFAVPANVRSIAVMERLGMSHDPADDFDHPLLPPGHRLRRHVLYRLSRD